MASITLRSSGQFKNARRWLKKLHEAEFLKSLDSYGKAGVDALAAVTPKRSGMTASSWSYRIDHGADGASITWTNSNRNEGYNIAILIQYGHGTGSGGYVQGCDYINPTMKPIFDEIKEQIWQEVRRL